jgi:hypothetical protein
VQTDKKFWHAQLDAGGVSKKQNRQIESAKNSNLQNQNPVFLDFAKKGSGKQYNPTSIFGRAQSSYLDDNPPA